MREAASQEGKPPPPQALLDHRPRLRVGGGLEPAEPGAGGGDSNPHCSARSRRRGPPAMPAARCPARGVPGGRGAPAAPPAPRGDLALAAGRAARAERAHGTKAPLLSGGRPEGHTQWTREPAPPPGPPPLPPAPARTRPHTHTHSRDFSDSSRECRARGQPPRSAQVSGCAGGSGVPEALALPQSPPCNPDPPERARRGGGASWRHAPSRHRLTPRRPRPRQPGAARAGISNARDCARRGGGGSCTRPAGGYAPASAEPPPGCRTEGPGRASLWTAAGSQAVGRKCRRANMLGQTAEQINSGWPGIRPRGPSGASRSIRGNLGGEWVRGPEKTVSESSGSGVAGLLRSLGQASST